MNPSQRDPEKSAPSENALARFLRLIRFSHTVFALPFALGALVVAANGLPSTRTFFLVLVCMVSARTAAMLFNRFVDWSLDQRNPRTASRHLLLSKAAINVFVIISSAVFLVAAAAINRLTFILSPAALAVIFFYSLTKRFTAATHFFLGVALAISPIGAWIAARGQMDLPPIVLAIGVVCWVAGFDLIYATQDIDFDRREGIHSMVVRFGIPQTLRIAQFLHAIVLAALVTFGVTAHLGTVYFYAMPIVAAALVYEHRSAGTLDVGAINRAFFHSNAFVSGVFLAAVCLDRLI